MEKWQPKDGEIHWWVTVPYCWDMRKVKIKKNKRKSDSRSEIFGTTNCFKTREEALEKANAIRRLFGHQEII